MCINPNNKDGAVGVPESLILLPMKRLPTGCAGWNRLLAALLLLLGGCLTPEGYYVEKVADGDTLTLLDPQQRKVKVRLYGIDAPESKQPYGRAAADYARQLALGQYVQLVEKNKDRYGRVVAEVILPDGRNLNHELVRAGCAWHYVQYANDPQLAALETEARLARRGLWATKRPQAPWLYRKKQREKRE